MGRGSCLIARVGREGKGRERDGMGRHMLKIDMYRVKVGGKSRKLG